MPGTGPVSVSTRVYGLRAGEWAVSAELLRPAEHTQRRRLPERRQRLSSEPVDRASWSWRRWALSSAPATPVKTRLAPLATLAMTPAVMPGIWPILGSIGVVVAVTQAAILQHESVPVDRALLVSMAVITTSIIAAKLWYRALHPGPWQQWIGGWSVDGFVFVGPIVALAALVLLDVPIGPFLDASAPGLFFGIAIGRLGCFFTGCCAGRATRSRWAIWSSDRHVGTRRIPARSWSRRPALRSAS